MTREPQGFVDLHTHTNFSDGRLTPEELVEEAVWRGLSAVALTDHDNIDGLERAAAAGKERGIEIVPGVELSCEKDGAEVHIVGLFIEPTDTLKLELTEMRHDRESRMEQMVKKLQEMGFRISMDNIPQESGKSFGRPHLAQALLGIGAVRSIGEAFARFIGDDGPAYVPKKRFTVPDGITRIHECGGVAILAHPGVIPEVFRQLPLFLDYGIDGVEAFYPKHTEVVSAEVVAFCKRHNLVISGGSDFHANGEGPDIGVPKVSACILEDIRQRVNDLRRSANGL